jgi:hypothetical protein
MSWAIAFERHRTIDVIERHKSIIARARFLRDIRRYRSLGYHIVYVDETWVNQNHCRSLAWYPKLS